MTDYIEWNVGPMPVDGDTLVDVILYNGERWHNDRAGDLSWHQCKWGNSGIYPLSIVKYHPSVVENT